MGHLAQRAHARGLRDGDARLSRAAALFRQAMALPPDSAAAAADLLAQAAALTPEIATYRAAQGQALARAGDQEGAVSALDAALAIAPADHASLQTLVTSLSTLDRQPEALARTEALSVLLPDSVAVARAAAQAALAARRPRVALFHAQRALTINPAHPAVHHLLARIHRRTGNTAMADRRAAMATAIEDATRRRKPAP
jgi:tetratricopeptide (TPR) repeat protein